MATKPGSQLKPYCVRFYRQNGVQLHAHIVVSCEKRASYLAHQERPEDWAFYTVTNLLTGGVFLNSRWVI